MKYTLTFESGLSAPLDDVAYCHLLRQAVRRGYERTRVRGGWVVTDAEGRMAALLKLR